MFWKTVQILVQQTVEYNHPAKHPLDLSTVTTYNKISRTGQRCIGIGLASEYKPYQILKINGFPTITIGSKRLVEKSSLIKWLDMNKGKDIIL